MDVATPVFWAAVALLAYTYAGYPLVLWAWARRAPRRIATLPVTPSLTVVVVAHDEAGRIASRLDNLLACDYPPDRVEIIVASDGSGDDTARRARAHGASRVRVVEFRPRRGKSAVLNDVMPLARGELVVLADARQRFEPGALRALAANFADPEVGAAGGLLMFGAPAGAELGAGVDAYWRYETWLRRREGEIDSTVGVSGAIYALRRALYEPIPDDTLLDDVLIPLGIARRGHRVVFEPHARAWDEFAPTAAAEFARKVRTLAGNFQLFAAHPWLWNPRQNRLWLQTLSHKACRLLGPACLAAALLANLALLDRPFYRVTFAAQLALYACAALGRLTRAAPRRPWLPNASYAFCLLNWATLVALARFASGRQRVTWEKAHG